MPDSKGARPNRSRPGTGDRESHTGRTRTNMATATTKTTTRTRRSSATAVPDAQPEPTGAPAEVTSELLHLDPRTLLIEGNIRSRAELDEDFVTSVREHG